jgi:hypothetical protein
MQTITIPLTVADVYGDGLHIEACDALKPYKDRSGEVFGLVRRADIKGHEVNFWQRIRTLRTGRPSEAFEIISDDIETASREVRTEFGPLALGILGHAPTHISVKVPLGPGNGRFDQTSFNAVHFRHGVLVKLAGCITDEVFEAAELENLITPSPEIFRSAIKVLHPSWLSNHERFVLAQEAQVMLDDALEWDRRLHSPLRAKDLPKIKIVP